MNEVFYKMIAIDLDGTLLSPQGVVTPRTKTAIRSMLQQGLKICFATGRNFTESQPILSAVEHYDAAVFVGGAMVIDTHKRLTLHRTLMAGNLARELCVFFESRGQAVLALQDTGHAGFDYLISQDIPPNVATRQWLHQTHAVVRWSSDLGECAHEHTIRIGIVAPSDQSESLDRELADQFGSRIVSHRILVPSSGVHVLEVFDPAVNKWEGIQHVARSHGIESREIVAIGDDVNDIPMVSRAGLGIAMGNGHPRLKAIAHRVIGHNHEDGLACFLEELGATLIRNQPTAN